MGVVAIIIYHRCRYGVARANLAYPNQSQLSVVNVYAGQPPYQHQYPPQAYGPGGVHAHTSEPNAGFVSVRLTRPSPVPFR